MSSEQRKSLEAAGVHFVRVVWCDNAGITRSKAIHVGVLDDYVAHGVGISAAQQAIPVMYDAVVADTGLGPVGEIRLVPDWDTLVALPYSPGHARAMGDMVLDGTPWALCPRDFLRRMQAAAAAMGLAVEAAFESEFYLLRATPDGAEPVDRTPFAATLGMDASRAVIDEIAEALIRQNIPVELYHPEAGPGQQEISIRHAAPLTAADRHVIFRETARGVALRHGQIASFLPKIFADSAGSGSHLHLSLWRDGASVMADKARPHALSEEADAFMAGILAHLPALMCFTTPSSNSYRRIRPHFWAGAYACWGVDNREAALRLPSHPGGAGPTNFELKTVDGTCNPYVALGATIACGLDGIRRRLTLPEPIQRDPADIAEGGPEPLPINLGEALETARADTVVCEALGEPLARAYLAIRQAEWDAMQRYELADEVKLLLDRY